MIAINEITLTVVCNEEGLISVVVKKVKDITPVDPRDEENEDEENED